jgi:hypothetical protein
MTTGHEQPTGADRLRAARGVIADVAHYTPQELRAACRHVLALSDDDEERQEAEGLLAFFGKHEGGARCAKS